VNGENPKDNNTGKEKRYIPSGIPKHLPSFSPDIMNEEKHEKRVSEITVMDMLHDLYAKKWIRFVAVFILLIVMVNFMFFRYDDWTNGCHINIQFSLLEWNNLEMKRALKFIKNKSPKDYQTVCKNVDEIVLFLPCDFSLGGCFRDANPKQIGMYTLPRDKEGNPSLTASVIFHEACHAIQKEEDRTAGDREAECYRDSYRFLKDVGVSEDEIPQNWKVYN
jgi:hypothetical protein